MLYATWVITALAASCPVIDLVVFNFLSGLRLRPAHPPTALIILGGVYGIYSFFLWASGKFVSAALGILAVLAFFKKDIPPKTKVATVTAAIIACFLLLYWASVVSHQW